MHEDSIPIRTKVNSEKQARPSGPKYIDSLD